jgi:hypothetical protein
MLLLYAGVLNALHKKNSGTKKTAQEVLGFVKHYHISCCVLKGIFPHNALGQFHASGTGIWGIRLFWQLAYF